jgi:hypothetical protein
MMNTRLRAALALACLPMLGAWVYAGPKALRASRPMYNQRYRDTPYFTSVERIAASLELNMSIPGNSTITDTASTAARNTVAHLFNFGPGAVARTGI